MKGTILFAALLVLGGCGTAADRELQMFVAGDIANAAAISTAAGDQQGAACATALAPVAMASPNPSADGVFVLAARYRALNLVLLNSTCSAIVAQALLQAVGKTVPFPFNLVLP